MAKKDRKAKKGEGKKTQKKTKITQKVKVKVHVDGGGGSRGSGGGGASSSAAAGAGGAANVYFGGPPNFAGYPQPHQPAPTDYRAIAQELARMYPTTTGMDIPSPAIEQQIAAAAGPSPMSVDTQPTAAVNPQAVDVGLSTPMSLDASGSAENQPFFPPPVAPENTPAQRTPSRMDRLLNTAERFAQVAHDIAGAFGSPVQVREESISSPAFNRDRTPATPLVVEDITNAAMPLGYRTPLAIEASPTPRQRAQRRMEGTELPRGKEPIILPAEEGAEARNLVSASLRGARRMRAEELSRGTTLPPLSETPVIFNSQNQAIMSTKKHKEGYNTPYASLMRGFDRLNLTKLKNEQLKSMVESIGGSTRKGSTRTHMNKGELIDQLMLASPATVKDPKARKPAPPEWMQRTSPDSAGSSKNYIVSEPGKRQRKKK